MVNAGAEVNWNDHHDVSPFIIRLNLVFLGGGGEIHPQIM